MARRKLGFNRAEWDALPWCDQQMYLEGIAMEADPESENRFDRPTPEPQAPSPALDDAFDKALFGAKRRRIEKAT